MKGDLMITAGDIVTHDGKQYEILEIRHKVNKKKMVARCKEIAATKAPALPPAAKPQLVESTPVAAPAWRVGRKQQKPK
jgi:hypothetical protein